jgi:hypothetical protein
VRARIDDAGGWVRDTERTSHRFWVDESDETWHMRITQNGNTTLAQIRADKAWIAESKTRREMGGQGSCRRGYYLAVAAAGHWGARYFLRTPVNGAGLWPNVRLFDGWRSGRDSLPSGWRYVEGPRDAEFAELLARDSARGGPLGSTRVSYPYRMARPEFDELGYLEHARNSTHTSEVPGAVQYPAETRPIFPLFYTA